MADFGGAGADERDFGAGEVDAVGEDGGGGEEGVGVVEGGVGCCGLGRL